MLLSVGFGQVLVRHWLGLNLPGADFGAAMYSVRTNLRFGFDCFHFTDHHVVVAALVSSIQVLLDLLLRLPCFLFAAGASAAGAVAGLPQRTVNALIVAASRGSPFVLLFLGARKS